MLKYRLIMSAVLIPVLGLLFYLDAWTGPIGAFFGPLCMLLSGLAAYELVEMLRNRVPTLTRSDVIAACASLVFVGWGLHAGPVMKAKTSPPASYRYGALPNVGASNQIEGVLSGWSLRGTVGRERVADTSATTVAFGFCGAVAVFWLVAWLIEAAIRYERGQLDAGQVVPHVSTKLLVLAYAGGLVAATMQLRWFGNTSATSYRLLAGLLIAVKSGDIGAYFVGRAFGRKHPLKRLSPGKTGAGFVGAVVTGTVAFTTWMSLTRPTSFVGPSDAIAVGVQVAQYAIVGLVLAVGGISGDLIESLLKRECGVKDSSALLPGFGGVLDVLDSVLFVGAFVVASATAAAGLVLIVMAG